jgi:hypothetical protein
VLNAYQYTNLRLTDKIEFRVIFYDWIIDVARHKLLTFIVLVAVLPLLLIMIRDWTLQIWIQLV